MMESGQDRVHDLMPAWERQLEETVKKAQHARMSDEITRPELDAKLEIIETRMDARVQRIEDRLDSFMTWAKEARAEDRAERNELRAEMRNFKWWAMGVALAAVIGLYAANVSLLQGFVAAFESGRTTGRAQSEATAKGDLTTAPAKPAPSPPAK